MNTDAARLTLHPIGYIHTHYRDRSDAPHQPDPRQGVEATIELLPGQNFEQALEDLDGIEKIWILYWFDRNPNWKPKVQVPRGPVKKRGVFATRSPHRPNPIGLTLVDLVEVRGLTVRVRNVDLLDGTPILDIKPYLPRLEAYPDAQAGWIDAVDSEEESERYQIHYSALADEQLSLLDRLGVPLRDRIQRVLSRTAEPHPYKRVERDDRGLYYAFRAWRVRFTVDETLVSIVEIRSGYSRSAFVAGESAVEETGTRQLVDEELQRTFHEAYPESLSDEPTVVSLEDRRQ